MTEKLYTIRWLGYNDKDKHGRIWGWIAMTDDRAFAFWGTKGGKILFRRHHFGMDWLIEQSKSKGFKQINPEHYELICQGFQSDLEIWLTTAILADEF